MTWDGNPTGSSIDQSVKTCKCVSASTMIPVEGEQQGARTFDSFFKFGKQLGKGYQGTVYLCTHKVSGKEYAVKVLRRGCFGKVHPSQKIEVWFHKEYLFTGKKDSDRVPLTSYIFETACETHIVMEYIKGLELGVYLANNKESITLDHVKHLSRHILEGLEWLHNKYLVHHDLKPENILVREGNAIINDWGSIHAEGEYKLSDIPCHMWFMPPELHVRGETATLLCVSDIWSFGVTFLKMIYGPQHFLFQPISVEQASRRYADENKILKAYASRFCHKEVQAYREEFNNAEFSKTPDFSQAPWIEEPGAIEFVTSMFQLDYRKRFGAKDARNHPWLNDAY